MRLFLSNREPTDIHPYSCVILYNNFPLLACLGWGWNTSALCFICSPKMARQNASIRWLGVHLLGRAGPLSHGQFLDSLDSTLVVMMAHLQLFIAIIYFPNPFCLFFSFHILLVGVFTFLFFSFLLYFRNERVLFCSLTTSSIYWMYISELLKKKKKIPIIHFFSMYSLPKAHSREEREVLAKEVPFIDYWIDINCGDWIYYF